LNGIDISSVFQNDVANSRHIFSRLPDTQCNRLWPSFSFPRREACGELAASMLKCQLKPSNTADYTVSFTASELARLNAIFRKAYATGKNPVSIKYR
jgi:hypothetical protein